MKKTEVVVTTKTKVINLIHRIVLKRRKRKEQEEGAKQKRHMKLTVSKLLQLQRHRESSKKSKNR